MIGRIAMPVCVVFGHRWKRISTVYDSCRFETLDSMKMIAHAESVTDHYLCTRCGDQKKEMRGS